MCQGRRPPWHGMPRSIHPPRRRCASHSRPRRRRPWRRRARHRRPTAADRIWARAQDLVTIRRGDHVLVGDPAAGLLAERADELDAGDLAGAVRRRGADRARGAGDGRLARPGQGAARRACCARRLGRARLMRRILFACWWRPRWCSPLPGCSPVCLATSAAHIGDITFEAATPVVALGLPAVRAALRAVPAAGRRRPAAAELASRPAARAGARAMRR